MRVSRRSFFSRNTGDVRRRISVETKGAAAAGMLFGITRDIRTEVPFFL